jgi:hypothetical protein
MEIETFLISHHVILLVVSLIVPDSFTLYAFSMKWGGTAWCKVSGILAHTATSKAFWAKVFQVSQRGVEH